MALVRLLPVMLPPLSPLLPGPLLLPLLQAPNSGQTLQPPPAAGPCFGPPCQV